MRRRIGAATIAKLRRLATAAAADPLAERYHRTAPQRLTQLVVCDLSTPTGKGHHGWNAYVALRELLVARGVVLAPITLHTGVSSQAAGEPPYAERFVVPPATAVLVDAARRDGRRVVAVGTTVVRALESTADERGRSHPGHGWTDLVVTPERGVRGVDGLLTGWHEPESSHLAMLEAIAGRPLLDASYEQAVAERYRWHEFGDSHLILP